MRKKYICVITLILLAVILWAGYSMYLQYKPVVYQNGILI